MKSSKQLLLIFTISICAYQAIWTSAPSTQSSQTMPEPVKLQKLKAQEQELINEILGYHDSKLHQHKVKIISEMAQAKVNKQAKIDNSPASENIPFGTLEYWKRQIALKTVAIEDLQKLLQREQDGKESSAKIHADLKEELLLAQQEPGSRNQDLES